MALQDWDLVCVTGTSLDADGFGSMQYDAEGEAEAGAPPYEQHQWLGLWAMPLDPVVDSSGQVDAAQACTMLKAVEGGKGHAWACEDPRVVAHLVPAPAPGETVLYNSFGAFSRYHADGAISHATTTTGGTSDGQSVFERITPTGFVRTSPWGTELFGAQGPAGSPIWSGYSLSVLGGARFTLGFAGGLIPNKGSYARFQCDLFEVNAAAIAIGPDGTEAGPVAKVIELTAALVQVTTALQALAAAVAAFTGTGTFPGIAAAQAAIVTAAAAVVALPTTAGTAAAIG